MELSEAAKLIAIVSNDFLEKSDCIVVLEGDFFHRADEAARLFKAGYADCIVTSSGVDKPKIGCYNAELLRKYLIEKYGVPEEKITVELESLNTREEAVNVLRIAKEKNWRRLVLVASPFHQVRAFLTFLKAMSEANMQILIFNAPAGNLPWFEKELPKSRYDLLDDEFRKIEEYGKLGHIASFEEAIEYQKWKEGEVKNEDLGT